MKLVLGAAQFGAAYGVTRESDHVSDKTLSCILEETLTLGISMVDTSPAYGDAEARLGHAQPDPSLKLQTKTRGGQLDLAAEGARSDFEQSKYRLGRKYFDSFLIHSVGQLFGPNGAEILRFLMALKERGEAARIGVSVYDVEQIDRVLALFTPDVVQVPVSAADQRLVDNGGLEKLKTRGVCVQTRSVFLQGVLLTAPDKLPDTVGFLAPHLARFQAELPNAPARCFGFLESTGLVDEVVAGVHSVTQLREIARAFAAPECDAPWSSFKFPDELVDPRYWESLS